MEVPVFRISSFENGRIGVGVLLECVELLVLGSSLRGISRVGVGAGQADVSQNQNRIADRDAAMAEDHLELVRRLRTFVRRQESLAAEERGIERAEECGLAAAGRTHFVGYAGLQRVDLLQWFAILGGQNCTDYRQVAWLWLYCNWMR